MESNDPLPERKKSVSWNLDGNMTKLFEDPDPSLFSSDEDDLPTLSEHVDHDDESDDDAEAPRPPQPLPQTTPSHLDFSSWLRIERDAQRQYAPQSTWTSFSEPTDTAPRRSFPSRLLAPYPDEEGEEEKEEEEESKLMLRNTEPSDYLQNLYSPPQHRYIPPTSSSLQTYASEFSPSLHLVNVPADGACFYSSVFHQLYEHIPSVSAMDAFKRGLFGWAHRVLETMPFEALVSWFSAGDFVEYIKENQTSASIRIHPKQDLLGYQQPGVWGDEKMIIWMAHYLQLPVQVIGNPAAGVAPISIHCPTHTFGSEWVHSGVVPSRFRSHPHHIMVFLDYNHFQSLVGTHLSMDHIQFVYAHSPYGLSRQVPSVMGEEPYAAYRKFKSSTVTPIAPEEYFSLVWPSYKEDVDLWTRQIAAWKDDPQSFPASVMSPLSVEDVQAAMSTTTAPLPPIFLSERMLSLCKMIHFPPEREVQVLAPFHQPLILHDLAFITLLMALPPDLLERAGGAYDMESCPVDYSSLASLLPSSSTSASIPMTEDDRRFLMWRRPLAPVCSPEELEVLWQIELLLSTMLPKPLNACYAPRSIFHYNQWFIPVWLEHLQHYLLIQVGPMDQSIVVYDGYAREKRGPEYVRAYDKIVVPLRKWITYKWKQHMQKIPRGPARAHVERTLPHQPGFMQFKQFKWRIWALSEGLPMFPESCSEEERIANDGTMILSYLDTLLAYRQIRKLLFEWDERHLPLFRIYSLHQLALQRRLKFSVGVL